MRVVVILMAALGLQAVPRAAQAADLFVEHNDELPAGLEPVVTYRAPIIPAPARRFEPWSTTYYPALPWGHLRKQCPIALKRRRHEERYSRPVLVRKG